MYRMSEEEVRAYGMFSGRPVVPVQPVLLAQVLQLMIQVAVELKVCERKF